MTKGGALGLGLLALIGLIHLPYPFHGDQALFMIYAQALDSGRALYADVWDVKQPGIYLLFWLSGKLFGFSEQGAHLLELVYLLAASYFMTRTAPFRRPWLLPLCLYGTYYASAAWQELTQVEILVSPLIYFCFWAAWRKDERPWVMWCAGLAVGFVALLKLALAPIPAAVLLVGTRSAAAWLRVALGAAAVWIPVAAWLARHDALGWMLWTTLSYPGESIRFRGMNSPVQLLQSLRWFAVHFLPWVIAAAFAAPLVWKDRRSPMIRALVVWIAMAAASITAQVISWWPYHFLLLMPPVAVLAMMAMDRLPGRWPVAAALAGLLIFTPQMLRKVRPLTWGALTGNPTASVRYQNAVSPTYAEVWKNTGFLRASDARPGPMFVFGTPLYLWLTGRRQEPGLDGWGVQFHVPSQWRTFTEDLRRTRPVYVFAQADSGALARQRWPEAMAVLDEDYRVKETSSAGTWYELSTPSAAETQIGKQPMQIVGVKAQ